jgi:hypothetical protein
MGNRDQAVGYSDFANNAGSEWNPNLESINPDSSTSMTARVFKYPLFAIDEQHLQLPIGAQILTVQMQGDMPFLWALVDDEKATEPHRVLIRGTGHDADGVGRYISTFQMGGGALVFHAFEGWVTLL